MNRVKEFYDSSFWHCLAPKATRSFKTSMFTSRHGVLFQKTSQRLQQHLSLIVYLLAGTDGVVK
jgi:hypothetical protein